MVRGRHRELTMRITKREAARFTIAVCLGVMVALPASAIYLYLTLWYDGDPSYWSYFLTLLLVNGTPFFLICSLVTAIAYSIILKPISDGECRCRKCGYILKGISEPKCSECGEQI